MNICSIVLPALLAVSLTGPTFAEVMELPVPVRVIYPGHSIQPSDVTGKPFEVSEIARRNFAVSSEQLVGKEVRRTLLPGKPIALSALGIRLTIKRGANLKVVIQDDGLEITAVLVAQQDGSAGDIIKAKNPASGAMVLVALRDEGSAEVVSE
jgi:flagellar basal body P-ring formation protein FlgA